MRPMFATGFHQSALKLCFLLTHLATTAALTPGDISHSSTVYDAIVVGGGPAGLSALSGLARVRRNVLLVDSGEYRNDPTRHMHDVLGYDGVTPAYFRWKARQQLSYYPTVSTTNGTVTKIDASELNTANLSPSSNAGDTSFVVQVTFPSGQQATVGARKIILATGMRDVLPATPGVQENWGRGIYWCPWCDGYEHSDQPLGLLGDLTAVPGLVQEIETLNSDIIAFVNRTDTPANRDATSQKSPDWERELGVYNVTLENRTISSVVRLDTGETSPNTVDPNAPNIPEHDLFRVDFVEGEPSIQRAAFFASFPEEQHSNVGPDMGVMMYGNRLAADPTIGFMTNIPGVYAIGDANSDNTTNVPHALYTGKRAAVFVHVELAHEDLARKLDNSTAVNERSLNLDLRHVWDEMNGGGDEDILDAGEFR